MIDEERVRAAFAAAGFPASDAEIAGVASAYPMIAAISRRLAEVAADTGEAPALLFDADPAWPENWERGAG